MTRVVLEKEKNSPGVSKSNHGGWHSPADLFFWEHECIDVLKERVASLSREIIRANTRKKFKFNMSGWVNVSRNGHYNNVHSHVGATWSAVYYVSKGEEDNDDPENGRLELLDPRVGVSGEGTRRHLIHPMPGLIVFFPSWLKHMVHPFSGTGVRISIAINIIAQYEGQSA